MKKGQNESYFDDKLILLMKAPLLGNIEAEALQDLAARGDVKAYGKGDSIFRAECVCTDFLIVSKGIVRVSIYGASGLRLTYLLARRGEPINLVSPFIDTTRSISAEAVDETRLFCVSQKEFLPWAVKNPQILIAAIGTLGKAVDSANRRLLDMVEKRVEQRLSRVLSTLYMKFGSPLHVTSAELAELTGTTIESTIRSLGRMRKRGIIRSTRGRIDMVNPAELIRSETEVLWL